MDRVRPVTSFVANRSPGQHASNIIGLLSCSTRHGKYYIFNLIHVHTCIGDILTHNLSGFTIISRYSNCFIRGVI